MIACIRNRVGPDRLHTFSAIFPGFTRDESAAIGGIAGHLGVLNHSVSPDAAMFADDFERVCYHQEEPFQSASVVAQYGVFRLAKEHGVTVLLDGQGADELIGGYSKYFPWYWRELYRGNRQLLRHELQATQPDVAAQWGGSSSWPGSCLILPIYG